MARLIYTTNVSLDGFIEDPEGAFDFLPPGDDVFAAHTELMESIGTLVYGRRLYEKVSVWEVDPSFAARSPALAAFAAAFADTDKVVHSTTLTQAPTARTRIERTFDADAVQRMKDAADRDLLIGGADLAGQALRAGVGTRCSSTPRRSRSAAGSRVCPPASDWISSCSTSGVSPTVWCCWAIARGPRDRALTRGEPLASPVTFCRDSPRETAEAVGGSPRYASPRRASSPVRMRSRPKRNSSAGS